MADSTDSTEVVDEKDANEEVDEQQTAQDETAGADSDTDTGDNEETGTEDDSSDDDEGFKPRLTQFKGDTPEEYSKNLEVGYLETSKEGVKLSKENKELQAFQDRVTAVIAANPELAKLIAGAPGQQAPADGQQTPASPTVNPGVAYAESIMQRDFQKEYTEFAAEHPEIETDPLLAEKLDQKLAVVRDAVFANEKRMVGMGEGLRMAWAWMGNNDDSQEKLRGAVRDQASSTKSASGAPKNAPKSKFSDEQITAMMDLQGVDKATAIKKLTEFASTPA